ncbi:MAG: hypothetical protein ACOYUZ_03410 [Patescibacteria group bacterium]
MSREIIQLLQKYSNRIDPGPAFTPGLTAEEKRLVCAWLASQRTAERPDREGWLAFLFRGKPFFEELCRSLISGRWAQLIRECAEPLDLNNDNDVIKDFPILGEQGIRFLLIGIDRRKIGIYGGEMPLLLDMNNDALIWRIQTKDQDSLSVKVVEFSDIPNVLLREWSKNLPRQKRARELMRYFISVHI